MIELTVRMELDGKSVEVGTLNGNGSDDAVFAYSEEYQAYQKTNEEIVAELIELAEDGKGSCIQNLEDTAEIFAGFITAIDKMFDPRYLFIIIAIVLFLLDIAVRKFKFKWPHELIRAYMAKRADQKKK